jgi:hypothetical protein
MSGNSPERLEIGVLYQADRIIFAQITEKTMHGVLFAHDGWIQQLLVTVHLSSPVQAKAQCIQL